MRTLSTTPTKTTSANGLNRDRSGILQRKCESCGQHTIAGGECASCAKNKGSLQRKLTIGASNDPLELEADRIADQVMAAPIHSEVSGAPLRIQRYTGQSTKGANTAPASVDRVLSNPGRPLESSLQQDMEQRFGHDFSRVRVHTDAEAGRSAQDVNANAYTVGHNIMFGSGRFLPQTYEGQRLIAHELTHTIQQQVGSTGIQRKIKLKRDNKWYEFGAHWRESDTKERAGFVTKYFTAGEQKFAKSIVEDMADSADDFLFDDENELTIEITKRMKTSNLMQESQASGALGKGFGYPDKTLGPRVNKAAKAYWGPVQDLQGNYFFELSDTGKQNAYKALTTLFTPQEKKSDRTLIHCDYLASVVHFQVFAEAISIKEFNDRVKKGTIPITLKWNGFQDIEVEGMLRSSEQESLQEVRPSSEKDLVIGDHVVFWNHRAYDLINENIREAWRLENAILEKKQDNGEDLFEGHGSGRLTNLDMRKELLKRYNEVVGMAQARIAKMKSKDSATSTQAQAEMKAKFPNVKQVGAEWHIKGEAHSKTFDEPIKHVTDVNDPQLIGLRDPNDPTKMNFVKRPKESA